MLFEKYLKEKGIELKPWQLLAAESFLAVMHSHKESFTGKTFLIDKLADFIEAHGNEFEIKGVPVDLLDSEDMEGLVPMGNAACIEVWSRMHEERVAPRSVMIKTSGPSSVDQIEADLYVALCRRLMVDSFICRIEVKDEPLNEVDQVKEFLEKRCRRNPDATISRVSLYSAYKLYCLEIDYREVGQRQFSLLVGRCAPDLYRIRLGGSRLYKGLELKPVESVGA
jgi:hypothetical protein